MGFEERIHVAVFPMIGAGSGHLNPMLEFSRRLIPLGFTVSFLLSEDAIVGMQDEGVQIQFVSIPCKPQPAPFLLDPELLQEPVEAALRALETPIKCIISDFFIGWSQDVANNMGVPRFVFITFSSAAELLYYHHSLLVSQGHVPVSQADLEKSELISCVPGAEPFHPKQLPLAFRYGGPGLPLLDKELRRMKESKCILVSTVEELEQHVVNKRRLEVEHYLPVGPLISRGSSRLVSNSACLKWLDNQAPSSVLYVAFGSTFLLPRERLEVLAEALERSGRPFVWALRKSSTNGSSESFFDDSVTRSESSGEGLFENLVRRFEASGQGLIVDWAPQVDILEHSSVGAFLTHCGWNSTMETGATGVPALCWPLGAEQNMNAAALVDEWKMGMHVGEGSDEGVSVEHVVSLIETALSAVELRKRAQEVQKIIKGSHEKGGSSHKNLEALKSVIRSLNMK